MSYKIKNWEQYQHFKDGSRNPPWIKLYKELLDNISWHEMDGETAKVLIMLWMVASENNGILPDAKKLAFRLRISEQKLGEILPKLTLWILGDDITMISTRYHDDINMISPRYQDDTLEEKRKEREVEREVEVEKKEKRKECSELEASTKPNLEILYQPCITFPTKGKTQNWSLPLALFHEIQETFKDAPIFDWIMQARLWAIANPIKQKTARGMPSFIIGWVTRQNDRPAQPRTYQNNGKPKPANLQEVLAKMPAGFVMPGEQKL